MHLRKKSPRHVRAANARWRAADLRAQAQRDAGIPDRPAPADVRQPITVDLRTAGGKLWRIEPRMGYIAWRLIDADSGMVARCAALKTLLHVLAVELPRTLSFAHTDG